MMVSYHKWHPHPFVLLTPPPCNFLESHNTPTSISGSFRKVNAAFTSALNVVFHRHCQNTVGSIVKVKHIGSRVSFMRGHLVPMNQEPH